MRTIINVFRSINMHPPAVDIRNFTLFGLRGRGRGSKIAVGSIMFRSCCFAIFRRRRLRGAESVLQAVIGAMEARLAMARVNRRIVFRIK